MAVIGSSKRTYLSLSISFSFSIISSLADMLAVVTLRGDVGMTKRPRYRDGNYILGGLK